MQHTGDQIKLENGHWSVSQKLLDWVSEQRRLGRTEAEIISQLSRVSDLLWPPATGDEQKARLTVPVEVDWEIVCNAITGALEGGVDPWLNYMGYERSQPSINLMEAARAGDRVVWYNDPAFWLNGGTAEARFDKPTEAEGNATGRKTIGKDELLVGLRAMAISSPQHFADLINENDDAITHDVFMQYVILGEVIYG